MDQYYWDIAAKQLAGKATAQEEEELHRWLKADPNHQAVYKEQQRIWELTAPPTIPEVDSRAAWQKVKKQIGEAEPRHRKVRPLFPFAMRVAASLALLFGLLWLVRIFLFPYYGLEVISSGEEQVSFMLPDSSQVWLNKGSTLAYDPDFVGEEREVQLEGEAFFEVQKDPRRPFIILTENSRTRVLGTSFNLRAYSHEAITELVVATGKVAFSSLESPAEAVLTPGYAALLERESNRIEKFSVSGENAWAWKSGTLAFEGKRLAEVLPELERHYGMDLQLETPALADCRFTGRFEQAGLEEILQVLEATLQLKYKKLNEQTYLLSGKGCK